ncbi:hypothetical protein ASPZODRAFT_1208258 [Penicilliopsis zonata CBS 506.65]|uniref:Uncharacterized protein n=1 Tax=Penicilliopsis zonata CBS 506.65 TaxID=1073090 RepID=A0A1L9S7B2_9EURO|nr:hypothetical protein ASPZODRAFT_1208258 [Penicilliopsis zonata CBS 506.65]OJJ43049.1 hypothetical protein ASPZODRAFT_1208258 [Penicilliopsis zonata CBS 506.65]
MTATNPSACHDHAGCPVSSVQFPLGECPAKPPKSSHSPFTEDAPGTAPKCGSGWLDPKTESQMPRDISTYSAMFLGLWDWRDSIPHEHGAD